MAMGLVSCRIQAILDRASLHDPLPAATEHLPDLAAPVDVPGAWDASLIAARKTLFSNHVFHIAIEGPQVFPRTYLYIAGPVRQHMVCQDEALSRFAAFACVRVCTRARPCLFRQLIVCIAVIFSSKLLW